MKDYRTVKEIINNLSALNVNLEGAFEDNGGEITPYVQEMLDKKEYLQQLLEYDGIDDLGRWLKGVEDRVIALKAERETIVRRIKADQRLMEYIKQEIRQVLDILGKDKAKGTLYSFSSYDSTHTKVNDERIAQDWQDILEKAAREAGIPEYLQVGLDYSAQRIGEWADEHDGEGREYLMQEAPVPTVKFGKPRSLHRFNEE